MASAPPVAGFVRRQARGPAQDLGTRPGLQGQTLISTGLADLDRILGGGLPLGSVLLLCEDAHSQQHLNLTKHFLAEGAACKHSVLWLTAQPPPSGGPAEFLPALARSSSGAQASTSAPDGQAATTTDGSELRIAWQYRKYIQNKQLSEPLRTPTSSRAPASSASGRPADPPSKPSSSFTRSSSGSSGSSTASRALEAGIAREWCHAFDLSKPLGAEALQGCPFRCRSFQGNAAVQDACVAALEFVQGLLPQMAGTFALPPSGPAAVGRLVVQSLGSPSWQLGADPMPSAAALEASLLHTVVCIRQAIQDTRCAAVITCPAGMYSPSFKLRLQHACDALLALETLADDSPLYQLLPDAASAVALLHVQRLPSVGLQGMRPPEVALHVVRYKRRRISLTAVEVDPDAEAQQAAAGGGGSGSVTSMLCAGPPAATKDLDF